MADKAVRVCVRGRVQGVGFRWSLRDVAAREGLNGWCRNLPDGAVEGVLGGDAAAVERVIAWCWQGPPAARVDQVEVQPAATPAAPGFRIVA